MTSGYGMAWLCVCLLLVLPISVRAQKQQKPPGDDATLGQTVTWLRNVIGTRGGFSYTKTTTITDPQGSQSVGPAQERLEYFIHEVEVCHIGWGEAVSGDEEMKMLHPENGPDQDFGVVEPHSATVVALDLAAEEGAGTSHPGDGNGVKIAIRPGAAEYWKVIARWAFVHNDGIDEPFGFVFADRDLAGQVAMALDHAIDLCSGPRNFVGDGCTTVNQNVERHSAASSEPFEMAAYINRGDFTVTCVIRQWAAPHHNDPIDEKYFKAHVFEVGVPLVFTLKPEEKFTPLIDGASSPYFNWGGSYYDLRNERKCYREHSVDSVGNRCADLHLEGVIE